MNTITPRPELYDDVAQQLERDETPMNLAWMEARGVTLEELRGLSQGIALVLRGYTALPPAERIAFVTRGVLAPRPIENKRAESS